MKLVPANKTWDVKSAINGFTCYIYEIQKNDCQQDIQYLLILNENKMKLNLALLIFNIFLALPSIAQQADTIKNVKIERKPPIEIQLSVNNEKAINITSHKMLPGSYTLLFSSGLAQSPIVYRESFVQKNNVRNITTVPGNNLTAQVVDKVLPGQRSNFRGNEQSGNLTESYFNGQQTILLYRCFYTQGELNPKIDSNYNYILPYSNGKKMLVRRSALYPTNELGKKIIDEDKLHLFYTAEQDTVVAIRGGLVIQIKDIVELNNGVANTNNMNAVAIEHEDGTMATYQGLKKGIWVSVGQKIRIGQALGFNTKKTGSDKFNVSIYIRYLKAFEEKPGQISWPYPLYAYMVPKFQTVETKDVNLIGGKIYTSSQSH